MHTSTHWNETVKKQLQEVANTIRGLSIDATQRADSGHPGLPLGCAEIGAYLYGFLLQHNPRNSHWMNRDRFILSAGHGSMLLYSCLHLSGFKLSLEEIKNFRQLHSQTPGHPESRETDGVETTTGPLGQGIGNAVGQALGLKMLAARFNTPDMALLTSKVYTLVGDGCMMEGVASEVSSLAGHLVLDNLVVIYDSNKVSLDGPLSESMSEDTAMRYKSYGWDVYEVEGNDLEALHRTFTEVNRAQTKPVLVIAHTQIGKGSPNKAGTFKVHGSPLGEEEAKLTKEALGISLEPFFVPQTVKTYFEHRLKEDAALEEKWNQLFANWKKAYPALWATYQQMQERKIPDDLEARLKQVAIKAPVAGRKASQDVISALGDWFPELVGGSADLSCSDLTMMKQFPVVTPGNFKGRNIKYGVREFGMATMASGLVQTGMWLPFIGTFMTFSDYMRNAIRLACLMRLRVVYQFTHDSIFLGEDGPTHQPVEQLASLRAMPHLQVIRPADSREVRGAWIAALHYSGPTALALSRQALPDLAETDVPYKDGVGRGAYILVKEKSKPDFTLMATGSEVSLALEVAQALIAKGKSVRVISMPCWQIFEAQEEAYKASVMGGDLGIRVSIEAASSFGWQKYVGREGITIAVDDFGASAPAKMLAEAYGFTVGAILKKLGL